MILPEKPFPTYKWRWLSVQPSESLLKPPFLLGVLRALQRNEGGSYSSQDLFEELRRIDADLDALKGKKRRKIKLARPPERNLFRNSGQYWRGTGLLRLTPGRIELTKLGHGLASGQITNDEFAALMVGNTILPNPLTYKPEEIQNWIDADLRIKPFELILALMKNLGQEFDLKEAYITPNELIKVVIPLAGVKSEISQIVKAIYNFRKRRLDISHWPNCAPDANDRRLAREFLLFLENFDICHGVNSGSEYERRFSLNNFFINLELSPVTERTMIEDERLLNHHLSIASSSNILNLIERQRDLRNVIKRPNQARFRKNVLDAANNTCILTSETIPDVLEAAHIIPVKHNGDDFVSNGFCMRVDIHRLFDAGKIKMEANGTVILNKVVETAVSYSRLPSKVTFPASVNQANIEWRSRYL